MLGHCDSCAPLTILDLVSGLNDSCWWTNVNDNLHMASIFGKSSHLFPKNKIEKKPTHLTSKVGHKQKSLSLSYPVGGAQTTFLMFWFINWMCQNKILVLYIFYIRMSSMSLLPKFNMPILSKHFNRYRWYAAVFYPKNCGKHLRTPQWLQHIWWNPAIALGDSYYRRKIR